MKNDVRACIIITSTLWCGGLPAAGQPGEYRVAGEESEIHVLAFRSGALGRLGHNHVVSASRMDGRVTVGDTADRSAFELSLRVAELTVDDPGARAASGSAFAGDVSAADRDGTRRNMLGERLLDADRYPEVRVRSTAVTGTFEEMRVTAEVEIKGARRVVELPVNAVFYGGRLVATGRATLSHADLGLSPFTAGFGALKVADELTFRYRVVAIAGGADDEPSGAERAPAVVEDDGPALPHGAAK